MIEIIIVDNHEFIRAGLKSILAGIGDIKVVGEAATGHDLLQALREKTPDALVLDMSMPGLSGLKLIKRIKTEWPKQKILVLTMHTNKQYAVRVIRAGAQDFYLRPARLKSWWQPGEKLPQAVPISARRLPRNWHSASSRVATLRRTPYCPIGNIMYSSCWLTVSLSAILR